MEPDSVCRDCGYIRHPIDMPDSVLEYRSCQETSKWFCITCSYDPNKRIGKFFGYCEFCKQYCLLTYKYNIHEPPAKEALCKECRERDYS